MKEGGRMFRSNDMMPLTKPTAYLLRMVVFLVLGAFIAFILYRQIIQAFNANPSLNALIFGVLIVGLVLAFRSVTRLYREIEWANAFLESDSGIVIEREPVLLLPMARMLAGLESSVSAKAHSERRAKESAARERDAT